MLADLYEARQGLECQAAILAAERRTEAELLMMESEVLEMEKVMVLAAMWVKLRSSFILHLCGFA